MYTDDYGLIVQADGDGGDTLQRTGLYTLGRYMAGLPVARETSMACVNCYSAAGKWIRHPRIGTFWCDPHQTSRDQLLGVFPMLKITGLTTMHRKTTWELVKRAFFAQNMTDFMFFHLGTVIRSWHPLSLPLYPLLLVFDLFTLLGVMASLWLPRWKHETRRFVRRGPDDVDDDNLILELACAIAWMPTPFTWLARKLHARYRPWNYGCAGADEGDWSGFMYYYSPVYGALRWKHRYSAGGNPDLATLWEPTIKRWWK